jgi:hypothetical protein
MKVFMAVTQISLKLIWRNAVRFGISAKVFMLRKYARKLNIGRKKEVNFTKQQLALLNLIL